MFGIADVAGIFDGAAHGDGQPVVLGVTCRCRPVDRPGNDEILSGVRHFDELWDDPARGAEGCVDFKPRAGPAVFGKMEVGGIEPFRHIPGLVDAQEEERHALRAFALQRRGPMASLFEADPEAGGKMVEIVFRGPRFCQEGAIGHQHGSGEIIGQFNAAAGQPACIRQAGAGKQRIKKGALFDQGDDMDQLEDAVRVIQRFGQQNRVAGFVMATQRVGHIGHRNHADSNSQTVAQTPLEQGIDLVRFNGVTAPEGFGGILQLSEVVAVTPEVAVDS